MDRSPVIWVHHSNQVSGCVLINGISYHWPESHDPTAYWYDREANEIKALDPDSREQQIVNEGPKEGDSIADMYHEEEIIHELILLGRGK